MVIVTSDSCKTLVQLEDHDVNKSYDVDSPCYESESSASNADAIFVATDLLLPADGDEYDYEDEEESFESGDYTVQPQPQQQPKQQQARIYLPKQLVTAGGKGHQQQLHVDDCLRCIPQLVEGTDELLANSTRQFSSTSHERFLYVSQAELAHATSQQCDLLLSDRATTCHILAVRSTSSNVGIAFGSMAHVDSGNCYEDDIRAMIQQHRIQHQSSSASRPVDGDDLVHMDLHILGGYSCDKSRDISNWIMAILAQLATENKTWLRMTLKTCAISSMNDNGHASPMGRGLGLDLKTGLVFLAKVNDLAAATPALYMRAARLWTTTMPEERRLGVIHTFSDNTIQIDPRPLSSWKPFPQLNLLLQVPDQLMVQLVSTSPHAEENVEEFCQHVRLTLECLRKHHISVGTSDDPLLFRRVAYTNVWKPLSSLPLL